LLFDLSALEARMNMALNVGAAGLSFGVIGF
jgi:hypothetical protein